MNNMSKTVLKEIRGLKLKKNRDTRGLFVAEGTKMIDELLNSNVQCEGLYGLKDVKETYLSHPFNEITKKEMDQISLLKTPSEILGVFKKPNWAPIGFNEERMVLLNDVRDPGNLGTIIRTCDWFQINTIICSKESVDCFNSKVVQSTMGSIARIKVLYLDLEDSILMLKAKGFTLLAADLEGIPYNELPSYSKKAYLFGNEAHGISNTLLSRIDQRITIPKKGGAESLNLSVSVGIILSQA